MHAKEHSRLGDGDCGLSVHGAYDAGILARFACGVCKSFVSGVDQELAMLTGSLRFLVGEADLLVKALLDPPPYLRSPQSPSGFPLRPL
jgi:hypothetical protein